MIEVDALDRGVNAVGTVTTPTVIARTRTTAMTDATAVTAVATPSEGTEKRVFDSEGVFIPPTYVRSPALTSAAMTESLPSAD
jgi:hypothetical protein